mgnify:CR=1 FL=1
MSPNFWTKLANYSHSGAKMIEVYCLCLCSVFTLNFRVSVSVRNWYGPAGCPRSFFPIHSGQEKSFLSGMKRLKNLWLFMDAVFVMRLDGKDQFWFNSWIPGGKNTIYPNKQ